jgi:predicted dehydrogenase
MNQVRVAVIGLGYWGPNLVRVFHELDCAHVVAACDIDEQRLSSIGKRYPAVGLVCDADEIFRDPNIDAVAIATPVSSHHALASSALAAGKHVFIEKPLAASSRDAADLIALAKSRGRVIMPGHTFLYSPPVVLIHDLIAQGGLGELFFISTSRVNLGLHQADISVAWDLAPHDFSILQYWLRETPTFVSALSRAFVIPGTPDVAFIDLEFASGPIAHVELSWLAPSKLRRTTIVGSEKMVVYDDTSNEPIRIYDSGVHLKDPSSFGEYRLTYRTGDIVSPRVDAVEPLSLELADFCRAILEGTTPRSSDALGLEVVRMVEAVDQSLQGAGIRVAVPDLHHHAPVAEDEIGEPAGSRGEHA